MSTIAYAALTTSRDAAPPGTSTTPGKSPGVGTYVDALAALVPAEVLTAHAAILSFFTSTGKTGANANASSGNPQVTIDDPHSLQIFFWILIALAAGIYIFGRMKVGKLDKWDSVRMLIPSAAFVCWTMLQKATAFDALQLPISDGMRSATAVLGAIVFGFIASALANKADATP